MVPDRVLPGDDLPGVSTDRIGHESGTRPGAIAERDCELLALVTRGDHDAFALLYDRHGRQALAVAYGVVGDQEGAEAAVHAAFLSAWRGASTFDVTRGSVSAWLLTLARTAAIDLKRARTGKAGRGATRAEGAFQGAPEAAVREPADADKADAPRVRAALAALPAQQRDAIGLAVFGGLTDREIADRTGASLADVRRCLRAGLWALRTDLPHTPLGDVSTGSWPTHEPPMPSPKGVDGPSADSPFGPRPVHRAIDEPAARTVHAQRTPRPLVRDGI